MTMNYEELDPQTRTLMLSEFEAENAGKLPYRSKALSSRGLAAFPGLLRNEIRVGNEVSLGAVLSAVDLWDPEEEWTRDGVTRKRRRNVQQSATRLAITEFSTWYVRALAKRLLNEGESQCQIYRGEQPKWEPGDCAEHEGQIVDLRTIYDNHRARYWPEPGDQTRFSIPFAPGCHHLIRRLK